MEKRKTIRRKTGELKAAHGVASDAESTVSTRSSNSSKSSSSSISWKKQQQLKAEHLSGRESRAKQERAEVGEEDGDGQVKSLAKLGAILEAIEVQMAMIVLIALDIGCTALEIHLHDQQQLSVAEQQLSSNDKHGVSSDVAASLLVRVATRLVESFTGFTLFLFLIELVILLAAFRHKFFAHAGYVVDLVVVSLSLAVELYAQTKVARLLGILRVWRVLRLVGKLLDQERAAHDTTRLLLEQEQLKLLHVRMQKDAAHESLKREYESREGIEQLLRGYKDEIVTLKEALQIAAQAVAEATMNENYSAYPEQYDHLESADVESSSGLYPGVVDSEWNYHQEAAAVHPKELQSDLGTQYGQENDDDDAAVVHPTEMNGVEEERQEIERVDHYQEATDLNLPGVKTDSEVEHWQESERSENEFEDALDE